jgi:pimeloyl-ACP methyl ester carboxylesterase
MGTGKVSANGIELVYETFGDEADPPLLLIMGLGVPRFGWDDRFCRALVERGLWVIRFDNRDVGESTHIRGAAPPDLGAALTGDASSASYRLEDMADDTASLVDALGIESAHVVGASMGGMIAQTLVIRHPERVRSLTSIMSTVALTVGSPRQEALEALLAPPRRLAASTSSGASTPRAYSARPASRSTRIASASSRGAPGTPATTPRASSASCWRCWPRATAPRRCARSTSRPW